MPASIRFAVFVIVLVASAFAVPAAVHIFVVVVVSIARKYERDHLGIDSIYTHWDSHAVGRLATFYQGSPRLSFRSGCRVGP